MNRFAQNLIFCAASLALWAGPAAAGLHVCNKTEHRAYVALGFFDGKSWGSRGWFEIAGGTCKDVVADKLTSRFYYLYAVHNGLSGAWNGNRSFCVGQGSFRAKTRDCQALGMDRKRFFQVDTGEAVDWTETLSD